MEGNQTTVNTDTEVEVTNSQPDTMSRRGFLGLVARGAAGLAGATVLSQVPSVLAQDVNTEICPAGNETGGPETIWGAEQLKLQDFLDTDYPGLVEARDIVDLTFTNDKGQPASLGNIVYDLAVNKLGIASDKLQEGVDERVVSLHFNYPELHVRKLLSLGISDSVFFGSIFPLSIGENGLSEYDTVSAVALTDGDLLEFINLATDPNEYVRSGLSYQRALGQYIMDGFKRGINLVAGTIYDGKITAAMDSETITKTLKFNKDDKDLLKIMKSVSSHDAVTVNLYTRKYDFDNRKAGTGQTVTVGTIEHIPASDWFNDHRNKYCQEG